MSETLSWEREGADWPNRESSHFVDASGLRWHVQRMGTGPTLLLLHGTGAATHTWRDLAPLLARRFAVIAPELPGHGFTGSFEASRMSMAGMAVAVADLLTTLDAKPALVVGHSAGAAVLVRMSIDGRIAPQAMVSLNGALLPFRGIAGQFYSPLAKLLALNPLVPRMFAFGARRLSPVDRLLRSTGSALDARGIEYYRRLLNSPTHLAGALGMMANWDLHALERDLRRFKPRLLLVACGDDRAVPADDAFRVRDAVPGSEVTYLRNLGHLGHEERPELFAGIIARAAIAAGIPIIG